jgi:hypothetical protein
MAETRIIQGLDEKLIAEGILDKQYAEDYAKVHAMLNSNIKKTGAILPEKVFTSGEKRLRTWLMSLYKQGASQDKLTSYLRCGLAHLSFDFIESSYKSIDSDDLITRALQSFKNREFNKTFFKAAEVKKPVKKKKAVKKKKKAVKKKKPAKKKIKKKAVKKKKVLKRKTKKVLKKKAKKTAGRKKTAKKKVVKKKKVKRKAAKKKAVKKNIKSKKTKKTKKKKSKKKSLFVRLFK